MDGSEYLKYVTERVVSYMERSEDRGDTEEEKDNKPHLPKKLSREPWVTRWFGIAPLGLMLWWGNRAARKNETHSEARSMNSAD